MARKERPEPIDPRHPALSATRPLFVDNRGSNTMAQALGDHLRMLRTRGVLPFEVCIASAFFNIGGYQLLADELERMGKVRLLLGADPLPEAARRPRLPGEPEEPEYTQRQVRESLATLDSGLDRERDLLPFDGDRDATIRRLLAFLRTGRIEVRKFEAHYLHAKAYIFRLKGGGTVVGSSNFTRGGLQGNLELNLGHYEDPVVSRVERWFDELWTQATPFDLAAVYERLMVEYPPYLIYLRVLFELYGDELAQEGAERGADGELPLTHFQHHGVWRALRILDTYRGVLLADGVGLGKTFLAGEIIREYQERRQPVLLVCPASLRDSTWRQFLHTYDFRRSVECVSYEQLAAAVRGDSPRKLQCPLDEFALVVVDEAHNYRNPSAPERAQVLRQVLMGPRRDVVLLSATPVNNSLWDLYHLLSFFLKQDGALADRGVLSLRARFQEAQHEDPFNLNPDLLFPVIDATTVKRTRKFIRRYYENDLITLPDGQARPIRFPKPLVSTITYDLEETLPGLLAELEAALMPAEDRPPRLTMARYQPEHYASDGPLDAPDTALVGLIRSGLLKRFESSVHAFARTLERMVAEHRRFLAGLQQGRILRRDLLDELAAAEGDDEAIDEVLATAEGAESADGYDLPVLRAAVEADCALLQRFRDAVAPVGPDRDPKLRALVEELAHIVVQARREAADEEDERRKRKVLIFSFFEHTVDWIEAHLGGAITRDRRLACYRGRTASVAGTDSRGGVSREQALWGFAPESAAPPDGRAEDRFDVLICTDVLAEGMNLQQCRNIINYDLPWNPMRLVQRHGRVDRIGSSHARVFLRTFFPDRQLDAMLNLEGRVRRKLAQAAASVGVEAAPIAGGAEGHQSFTETREEIERLRRGDAELFEQGGTASAAQTGEEYRQELRKALSVRRAEIERLPWKAGSGLAKGARHGHFFCARVGERSYLRFVPAPSGADEKPIVREIGTCLRLIECGAETPRVMPDDLWDSVYAAWQRARADIHAAWTHETDKANLEPRVSAFNRRFAAHLRDFPPRGIEQARLERCLDAVEAPCSRRVERMLREVFDHDYPSADARSLAMLEEVERIGLEPVPPPRTLPPIAPEEVHLICWLAISPEG